ncbi:MAG: class I SAM-dependent methyltransferase [Planctomycetota bacterium]
MFEIIQVNWQEYAKQYDLLMKNHAPYQELLQVCLRSIDEWDLSPGSILADFGGGTGNFSLSIAKKFPEIKIFYIDNNDEMIRIANSKFIGNDVNNVVIKKIDLDKMDYRTFPRIDGAIMINSLYATTSPLDTVKFIYSRLNPDSRFFVSDLGRRMKIIDWGIYLLLQSIKNNGIVKTIELFRNTNLARKENIKIGKKQKSREYWVHDLDEFINIFKDRGFTIEFSSNKYYRGYNDTVVARR